MTLPEPHQEAAEQFSPDDVDRLWDSPQELDSWLIRLGDTTLKELVPAVRRCLAHPDSEVRGHAVFCLGYGFRDEGFREEAKALIEDPDPIVSFRAVLAWASYYMRSGDGAVGSVLYGMARDSEREISTRSAALSSIGSVLAERPGVQVLPERQLNRAADAKSAEEFDAAVDWDAVDDFMRSRMS